MIRKILSILLITITLGELAKAQDLLTSSDSLELQGDERKISELFQQCLSEQDDDKKIAIANNIADELETIFILSSSFDYDFPNIKNISAVRSPNSRVRTITYGIALSDGTYIYHGFVQYNSGDDIITTRLHQSKRPERDPENANMQAENWYGAIYYEIAEFGNKNHPIYALIGWDGHNMFTNCKVLEQLNFDEDGKPIFGGLFRAETGGGKSRIIFQYAKKAAMTLKYNQKLKMIVGDHLATPPQYRNDPKFAGPDFSCDGFYYDNDQWQYKPDVDAKNKAQPINILGKTKTTP